MSWRLTVMCIVAAAVVCDGKEPKEVDGFTIDMLRLPENGGLDLCITGSDIKYISAIFIAENTASSEGVVIETHTETYIEKCFSFPDVKLAKLKDQYLQLILKATATERINDGIATADIHVPIDADYPTKIIVDVIGEATGEKAIRVNKALGTKVFIINNDSTPYSCPISEKASIGETFGPPCYFMGIANENKKFSLCIENIGEKASTVKLCVDAGTNPVTTKEHNDATVSTTTSVTLDNKGKQISLVGECPTDGTAIVEMVVRKGVELNLVKICKLELTGDCALPKLSILESEGYDIFVAYTDKDGTKALSYDKTTLKNRDLNGVALTTDIVEAAWTKDLNYYQLKRDPNTDGGFTTADVDCHLMEDKCYVYFTGLTTNDYTLTLGTIVEETWGSTITTHPEQESTIVPVVKDALETKINGVILVQDSSHADGVSQVCFEPSESNHEGTRHEAILIDEDSHWIKLYNSSQGDNQMQCFSPVNLMKSSLRTTRDTTLTVVIVERELSGSQVLASGQTKIALSALRAIKPEVDNGSEGSTSTLAIVGAAIGGIACLMALVAAAIMFVKKINRDNDGLKYPLHRTNIEQDSSYIHGLDNPIPTM